MPSIIYFLPYHLIFPQLPLPLHHDILVLFMCLHVTHFSHSIHTGSSSIQCCIATVITFSSLFVLHTMCIVTFAAIPNHAFPYAALPVACLSTSFYSGLLLLALL